MRFWLSPEGVYVDQHTPSITVAVSNRRSAWIAIEGIDLYTLLVSTDAAVVRAAMMG